MFKLFKNLNKKDIFCIFLCILFIVFQVWLDLKIPDYMSAITRLVQTEGSKMSEILTQGGYMLLCAGLSLIAAIIVGYFAAYVSSSFSKNVRGKLFNKTLDFSLNEMKKFKASSLITRTTNDITNVEMFLGIGLQMLIKAPITAVWAIFKILNKGKEWSIATGFGVVILLLIIGLLLILVFPNFKKVQKLIDNINELTREQLKGIRVIRAFNAETYSENKFAKGNNDLTKLQMFNQKMMGILNPGIYLIMQGVSLSIYIIGAYLINEASMMDKMTVFSNMVVFSSYAMQVISSFLMLAFIFILYPRAEVSANRINEVLDTDSSILDGSVTKHNDVKGKIEFKHVSFKYPDSEEYMLEDISFKAKKGDTVAFIGSTGSGKSTLINLVPRFYDVTSGEILIDDINVKDYNLKTLHEKIGYVPQKAVIFNDSIMNNILYGEAGKKLTKEMGIEASKIAQADDFITKMEKEYNSHIASGGTNVSGGQKQRISIARAIARKPEFYIFDDSFSALDYKTDYILRKALKESTSDVTSLIVAQRIGTIKDADLIVVLDNGKCVGMGTHKELLKSCEVYKEIAYSQLSKEELENA
ncbi:MAG: ABC transporter ATP-binding protein [Bacilli bacterium]|nr:ABC transporter ATP-binding protein [Bacilli bacterium]